MRDLGTLGGSFSLATAVRNGLIVGTSETSSGPRHAFLVSEPVTPGQPVVMQDLGTGVL